MRRTSTTTALVLSLVLLPCYSLLNVQVTNSRSRRMACPMKLHGMMMPRDDNFDDDRFDVELARRRLEAMMGHDDDSPQQSSVMERSRSSSSSSPFTHATMSLPDDPPPLTAIAKERRVHELTLLSRLTEGDEIQDQLWSLWFSERGPHVAKELRQIEELTFEGPRSYDEAEQRLRDLIHQHGMHFTEPVNRLATLLYLKGQLEESKALCEAVLSVKPWHFGALSGIVMVCAGLGDVNSARQWAARRLPPIQPTGPNRRRLQWVERAVEDARKSLLDAEKRMEKAFGKPDPRVSESLHDDGNNDDSWQ